MLVVTRHKGLVQWLLSEGLIEEGKYTLIEHATPDQVRGQPVIGVLPLSLACLTTQITEVVMELPIELRGKDLSLEDMKKYTRGINTYKVTKI